MCGRYVLKTLPQKIVEAIADVTPPLPLFTARYNIAPTQDIPVLRIDKTGQRRMEMLRWGLVPFWAKDPAIGNRLINARAETLLEKPAFRDAFRRRRCLIPADGFYEWMGIGKAKQPMFIHRPDAGVICFGGLWERWKDLTSDTEIESATIITVPASAVIQPIHDRMPLIIRPENYDLWLDPRTPIDRVQQLLTPYDGDLAAHPVSTLVNRPAVDSRQCIEEIAG